MSELTIDEMLDAVERLLIVENSKYVRALNGIRAVLERHRLRTTSPGNTYEVAIIKSFVERVENRLPTYDSGRAAEAWLKAYHLAVRDELAAMEASVEHGAE